MAAQNKLVERITHQKGRIQTMLAPWLRSAPEQSTSRQKKPGQGIPVGLRFKVAAQKMRVLDDQHSQFVHPEKTAGLGLNLKSKFREVSKLTHINPKIQRKSTGWSEVERIYPKSFSSEPAAPEEPGTLKRGSVIPRFTPTPTPEQLMSSLRSSTTPAPSKPAAVPPAKKGPVQPRLDPRSRLFTRVEEVTPNSSKPAAAESEQSAAPKETPRPAASHAQQVQRQAEPAFEPEPISPDLPTPKPAAAAKPEPPVEPEMAKPDLPTAKPADLPEPPVESESAMPLATQQRQIETHYARRPAVLDRLTTKIPPVPDEKKPPEQAANPVVKSAPEVKPAETPIPAEKADAAQAAAPKPAPLELPEQVRTEPVHPAKEPVVQPPVAPAAPKAAEPPASSILAAAKPIPAEAPRPAVPVAPQGPREQAPLATAQPKPAAKIEPAMDLPHALPVRRAAPAQKKPAVAKPVNRKPVSFPKVSQRASSPTVSRELDSPAPTPVEPQIPLPQESDHPEALRPGDDSLAQANTQSFEPARWTETSQRQTSQAPAAAQSSEPALLPPTQPGVLPVGPAPEQPSERLQARPVERPAETRQPMPLQKNLQKRLQTGKAYTQREPVNLPIRNSTTLPVTNRQNPPMIFSQKYQRVERGAKSAAQTVQREIDLTQVHASRSSSSMPVVARQPDHPAPAGAPKPVFPASTPASSFEPAPLDLAYPPAIPSVREGSSSSASQNRTTVSSAQTGTGGTVQRFFDKDIKGMASQAVSANTPKAADVGSMAQSALGVNPTQGLSPSSLKSDAKGAAMSALGLGSGSGGGTETGGGEGQSAAGPSAQAEAPVAEPPNLEQIAEDVLPILKRLLEIDVLRSGG